MRILLGIAGRIVFWLGLIYIVGSAALHFYLSGKLGYAIASIVLFPLTYMIFPWFFGLWYIWIISIIGYWVSTVIGRIEPVE